MSLALYNKFRPKTMDEVRGQGHVKRVLCSQVTTNSVMHAYLFTGPAGTGKTTCARLLAAMVNCSTGPTTKPPVDDPSVSLILTGRCDVDVYEIDAATNGGVDNIRKIRSEAYLAPCLMSKKISIIDECHRLTSAAWEGLLKIIEEPPSHVMFILCTTEPQSVIDTVKTRCLILDFKPLSVQDVIAEIRRVAMAESIEIEDEAVRAIACMSRGSLRQAITWLAQLRDVAKDSGAKVTIDTVSKGIGVIPRAKARDFVQAVINKKFVDALQASSDVLAQGEIEVDDFISQVACYCHDIMLFGAKGYDWEAMGYTKPEVDEMADMKKMIEEKIPGVDYKYLASRWIRVLQSCHRLTVFNMNQQFQADLAFVDMIHTVRELSQTKS